MIHKEVEWHVNEGVFGDIVVYSSTLPSGGHSSPAGAIKEAMVLLNKKRSDLQNEIDKIDRNIALFTETPTEAVK